MWWVFTPPGRLDFDLFRSGDGAGWEQVVEDGFGAG